MEGMMTEIMYEIPSDEDIAEVEITKDVVENQAKPRVERNPDCSRYSVRAVPELDRDP